MSLKKNIRRVCEVGLFLVLLLIPDFCKATIWEEGVASSLTPRPFKVDALENSKIDLGGTWKFNPSPVAGFGTDIKVPVNWSDISVPGEWTMQNFSVKPNRRAAYMRSFSIPADWKDYVIKLRCDAVYSDAVVWINGKRAGSHQGGMNAFEIDISDFVKPGSGNMITLGVMNESLADSLMSGTQYAAHPLGGILRKIYIIAVPRVHLSSLHLTTNWESKSDVAQLAVDYSIENISGKRSTIPKIQFELYDSSCRNLDGFSGLGITALTRSPLSYGKCPETDQLY